MLLSFICEATSLTTFPLLFHLLQSCQFCTNVIVGCKFDLGSKMAWLNYILQNFAGSSNFRISSKMTSSEKPAVVECSLEDPLSHCKFYLIEEFTD